MTKSLVSNIGAALDLGEDVAERLKEIAERDLADELAHKLAQDRPKLSKALSRVLSAAGLGKMQAFFKGAAESLDTNETLKQLTGPVANIPRKGIGWAWKSKMEADVPGNESVTPTLKGRAQGSARILQGPGYSFRGALNAISALKSPLPFGSLSSRAERSVRGSLRADFSHPSEMRVVEAACLDLPVISRLDDPVELLNAEAFRKATLEFSRGVRLGAEFRATNSLVGSIGANGAPVSPRPQTRVRYAVDWNRQGGFKLGIRRLKGGQLRLRLTDTQQVRNRRSLSLGAELRVRGLQKAIAPVMERIAELPEGLEELVKTYSQPGRIFERKFKEKMKLLDAPARKLLGIVSGSRSAEDLADGLAGAILDVTRSRADEWTGMLDGKVDAVIDKALAKFEVARDREEEIAALVKEKACDALDSLNDEMEERLTAVLAARSGADAIAAALAQFAEAREDAAEEMEKTAADLLAPFNKLLAHYRATEERLRSTVEAVEKGKLAARFARVVSGTRKTQALLVFDLDPRDAQAAELYREMLTGDFRSAMTAASESPSGAITLKDSVFKRVFDDQETFGITFNLFGLEMGSERKLSAKLRVEHDLGGQISVFEAEGSVSEEAVAFGEKQSMRVGSLLNFVTAPNAPDAFVVELKYTDKHMERKELREYIGSFEADGLIAGGATDRILADFDDFGAIADGKRELQIETPFALSRDEVSKICARNKEEIMRVAIEQQVACYRRLRWASDLLRRIEQRIGDSASVEESISGLLGAGPYKVRRFLNIDVKNQSIWEKRMYRLIRQITKRAKLLARFISRWTELEKNVRSKASAEADTILEETDLANLQRLHKEMLTDLRAWVDARGILESLWQEDLSPVAAAFLAALRELSDTADVPLVPILSWPTNGSSKMVAVV